MAETRALLTDHEREALAGDVEDDRARYEAASRVRSRVSDRLPDDLATLAEHYPDIFADVVGAVDAVDVEHDDQEASDEPARAPTDSAPVDVDAEAGSSEPPAAAGVEWRALDLPGDGATLEQRQDAVRELYDYLRHEGESTASEMRELVWAQTGYASARSAWKNCLADGLKQVAEQDDSLHVPSEGAHRWRYVDAVDVEADE